MKPQKPIQLTAPTEWNKLTNKQLFFVMKRFIHELPTENALIDFLCFFTKIKILKKNVFHEGKICFRFKKGWRKFLLTADEVTTMLQDLKFLLKESELTVNPLPMFKQGRKKLYGPADNLYNITLREFIFCEMNFMSFCQGRHVVYLNNIIAILWRPQVEPYEPNSPNYSGDRRERFNDSIFPKRSRKMILLKLYKRYALFNFYAGARAAMQKEFPNVFSADGGTSKPKNMAKQMQDLVRAVNGGDPTKNEKLLDINVRDILGEMESAHEKVEAMRSKNKKS